MKVEKIWKVGKVIGIFRIVLMLYPFLLTSQASKILQTLQIPLTFKTLLTFSTLLTLTNCDAINTLINVGSINFDDNCIGIGLGAPEF